MSSPRKTPSATRAQLSELTATQLELALPGIRSVFAARIVEHRLRHGPFRSAGDLARVRGLGTRRACRVWEGLRYDDRVSHVGAEPSLGAIPSPRWSATPRPSVLPRASASTDLSVSTRRALPLEDAGDVAAFESSFDEQLAPSHSEDAPRPSPRRLGKLVFGGVFAMLIGVTATGLASRAWADRATTPELDVSAVGSELAALREGLMVLRAEKDDADEDRHSLADRVDRLEEQSGEDGAAIAALDERSTATELRTKKSERDVSLRLVKAEDELLWHRLVWAAQHAAWKEKRAATKASQQGDGVPEE